MASHSAALRTEAPGVAALVRALLNVFKLRIGLAIMLCALAGIAVTPGPALEPWQVVALALAVLLSSGSAGAFNQYVERDLDAEMKRTRQRPFVTGLFRPGPGWPLAIALLLGVSVLAAGLATNWTAAVHVFLGAFVYGVVYTVWLKRRSWTNIVVGGLAGSFAVLAGAAAVDPGLAPTPLILAVVLFLWTPPHFWSLATALHKDYAAARVPMLPVVIGDGAAAWVILGHTIALSLLALAPFWYGMGWIYLAGAAAGGAYFTWRSIELVRRPCPPVAMRNFAASLLQLTLLLAGAIADSLLLGPSG
jgi:heme o synthase